MDAPCDTGIAEAGKVKRILLTLAEEATRLETQARTGMEAALIAAEKALVTATEATHVADAERAGATNSPRNNTTGTWKPIFTDWWHGACTHGRPARR